VGDGDGDGEGDGEGVAGALGLGVRSALHAETTSSRAPRSGVEIAVEIALRISD
jgi:hypothetical protein